MANLWREIEDGIQALISAGELAMHPLPTDGKLSLEELIAQQNVPFTSPTTGGTIHKIADPKTITLIANLIRQEAAILAIPGMTLGQKKALLAAWLCGESRFDPLATNPNNNKGLPTDSPYTVFLRTDIGIAQIDGSTLVGMPQFAHTPWQSLVLLAQDPSFAIPWFARQAEALVLWGREEYKPTDAPYCNSTPDVLGYNGYNAGRHGTMDELSQEKPLAYGLALQTRYEQFEKALAA